MLENSAIKLASVKFAGISLLPGSLLLVSGIIIWRLWRNQTQLKSETCELSDELKQLKKQVSENQAAFEESIQTNIPASSSSKTSPTKNVNPEKMGLFEYLINDNIQLRKQA